ncbi:hypothetical protein JOJ86_006037 [Rhodococcus percolatus]|uniref:hypothetical protein n=1 Tax=Rhodococcus opacus TaxID=37919 RepID=UPI0015F7F9C1|nr:hypothetical protein [Rhodococcus opacus]MBA8964759.1 hypothetical protein [Rhodococcus opacus]MBP2208311.1 hypothetical protein [Rhodococcus opacus]
MPRKDCRCIDTGHMCRHEQVEQIATVAPVMFRRAGHPGIWDVEALRALWARNEPGDRDLAERIVAAGAAVTYPQNEATAA